MSNQSCLICGSSYRPSHLEGLLQCTKCNFITTDLNLSDEELLKLYSEDYFHGNEYGDYLADKPIIQKNFRKRLKVLERYIDNSSQKNMFEVGCAYGFFLDEAQKHFRNVAGIDISEGAVKKAKDEYGLDAISGDFLTHELEKQDVFCMWDTIEHLKEPHLFIEKISNELNKDGLIAITTGDIGSFNARMRGPKWRQIHPPTHLHYFSKDTLKLLLEKNGFDVVYTGHPGVYMSLNNMFYIILVLKKKRPKLYQYFKKTGLLRLNMYWNLFDLVYIIGKKR